MINVIKDDDEELTKRINFAYDIGFTNLAGKKGGFATKKPPCKEKTIKELVDKLLQYGNIDKLNEFDYFKINNNRIYQSCGSDASEYARELHEWLNEVLTVSGNAKRNKIVEIKEKLGHFDYEYEDVQEYPQDTNYNEVDTRVFGCLSFCKGDEYVYIRHHGKLKPIGDFTTLKKNIKINNFDSLMKEQLKNVVLPSDDEAKSSDLVLIILERAKVKVNKLMKLLRCQIQSMLANKDLYRSSWNAYEYDENMVHLETKPTDVVIVKPEEYAEFSDSDFEDKVSRNVAAEAFLRDIPRTLIALGHIKLQFKYKTIEQEIEDEKGNKKTIRYKVLDGMCWRWTQKGSALTDEFWFSEVINKIAGIVKMNLIKDIPKTYSDDPSEHPIMSADMSKLKTFIEKNECYKQLKECSALNTLKSWMSEFEFKATMAWCYSALFPTKAPSEIALFLHTGGATGKSTLYRILEYAMEALTGEDKSEFSQRLLGNVFDKEDYTTWHPTGEVGLTKAALINIDEATTASLDLFKNFSGTPGGNKITGRKIYSEGSSQISYAKWLFTSNKFIEINGDDGSYQRRLAIIEHPEAKNLVNINGMSVSQLNDELKKEVAVFIAYGEKYYKELTNDGHSLDEVLINNEELANNLKKSVGAEANEEIWDAIVDILEGNIGKDQNKKKIPVCHASDGDEYRLGKAVINKLYNEACHVTGNDARYVGAFRKWLEEKFKTDKKCYRPVGGAVVLNDNDEYEVMTGRKTYRAYVIPLAALHSVTPKTDS